MSNSQDKTYRVLVKEVYCIVYIVSASSKEEIEGGMFDFSDYQPKWEDCKSFEIESIEEEESGGVVSLSTDRGNIYAE